MKKLLALLLALVMVLSLAACGGKTEAPAANNAAGDVGNDGVYLRYSSAESGTGCSSGNDP